MAKEITLLAVADDPGGARLLATILADLQSQIDYDFLLPLPRRNQYHFTPPAHTHFVEPGRLADFFAKNGPQKKYQVILAGTSAGESLEKKLQDLMRAQGMPIVAVLDAWVNYSMRFRTPSTPALAYLPNRLLVMNQVAKEALQAEGVEAERIHIVGHAVYEQVAPLRPNSHFGFVFVSQPLSELPENPWGYDQWGVLRDIQDAIRKFPQPVPLTIRLHPKDDRQQYETWLQDSAVAVTLQDPHTDKDLYQASCYIGMHSALLIDAFLAGAPVLVYQPVQSGQPGLVVEHPFAQMGGILRSSKDLHMRMHQAWRHAQPIQSSVEGRFKKLGIPRGCSQMVLAQLKAQTSS